MRFEPDIESRFFRQGMVGTLPPIGPIWKQVLPIVKLLKVPLESMIAVPEVKYIPVIVITQRAVMRLLCTQPLR